AVELTSLVAAPVPPRSPRRNLHLPFVAGAVAAVTVGTAVWWAWPQANMPAVAVPTVNPQIAPAISGTPAPPLSIVRLPFDDLTTDLSGISDSFVIARNTAFAYKGKPVDVKQVGRELGVRYVLEGSVRRAGDQVQVNAQLIDTETGAHLWANRFDTNRQNLP